MNKTVRNIVDKIGKLYKKRILNTKGKRIYIQDTELKETLFQPNAKIECEFIEKGDNESRMKILLDNKGKMSVSKRKRSSHINPVIDIRRKSVLNEFSKYNFVEIEIYGDEIIVKGFNEINKSDCISDLINSKKETKIIDIAKRLELRKEKKYSRKFIQEIFLSKASGGSSYGFEQITFDSLWSEYENKVSSSFSEETKAKTKENYEIALNMISLCSGAGPLDKGFVDQGFKALFAIDIEKDMVDTYKANLGNHAVVGNLNDYDLDTIPDAKLLVAGSPCQDFSNANRVTGKILDSEKNLLIRKIIEVAKKMPSLDVFVIENVPQLLTKGLKFVEEIKERLSDFDITINKVNSAHFGSAQNRERAIIIGSKIGKIELKAPVIRLAKTVRQAFMGLTGNTPNQLDYSKSKEDVIKRMSYVRPGGNFRDIPEELRGKGTHSNSYKRLEWDNQSITIANPRKSCIMPPEGNRILSIRECARLFDLPDTFKFVGSLSSKQQMIANAVPLSLSTAIAKAVKEAFISFYGENTCKLNFN